MSIYDIIVSMCHDIIHDLYDIMSLDTDIICYIIGYTRSGPKSGPARSWPLCWAPALLLPSVVRYQVLPGTVPAAAYHSFPNCG